MANININQAALDAFLHDINGPVGHDIERRSYNVENAAKRLLVMHGSGRVYDTTFFRDRQGRLRKGRPRVPHQASAPGEPPASDTGRLLASIGHRLGTDADGVYGEIFAGTNYAAFLEYGTRDMDPRPFMRPALIEGEQ
jgi:hypothetical protein